MKKILKTKRFLLLFAGALLAAACASVPYTHRKQFNVVSEGEEIKLGEQAYKEVLAKTPLSKNEEYQRQGRGRTH